LPVGVCAYRKLLFSHDFSSFSTGFWSEPGRGATPCSARLNAPKGEDGSDRAGLPHRATRTATEAAERARGRGVMPHPALPLDGPHGGAAGGTVRQAQAPQAAAQPRSGHRHPEPDQDGHPAPAQAAQP
jgi:hypothetical protein